MNCDHHNLRVSALQPHLQSECCHVFTVQISCLDCGSRTIGLLQDAVVNYPNKTIGEWSWSYRLAPSAK
jgi:hypothetical protein